MRQYAANDLVHQSLPDLSDVLEPKQVATAPPEKKAAPAKEEAPKPRPPGQVASLKEQLDELILHGKVKPDDTSAESQHVWRRTVRQVLPGPYYPRFLRRKDKGSFDDYMQAVPPFKDAINALSKDEPKDSQNKTHDEIATDSSRNGQKQTQDKPDTSSSPTVLSASQKIYDAEVARRESINTRCTTVLSTAGILGALFVAAGTLGLNLKSGPVDNFTWTVLVFFLIALAYLGYSITIALHVHGDIQGEVIDWNDLVRCHPEKTVDEYNFNVATALLLYANLNWCLNNNFKYRLHSAGRALRNGVIAIILAGALSPWAVTPTTSNTTGATGTTGVPTHTTLVISGRLSQTHYPIVLSAEATLRRSSAHAVVGRAADGGAVHLTTPSCDMVSVRFWSGR